MLTRLAIKPFERALRAGKVVGYVGKRTRLFLRLVLPERRFFTNSCRQAE